MEHECSLQRGVGYFLEPLVLLAPFAKKPVRITLRGVTNTSSDPSVRRFWFCPPVSVRVYAWWAVSDVLSLMCVSVQVDYFRMCVLPLLKKFLPENDLQIKVSLRK